jgi:predicted metal-dependent hydrolase
MEQSNHQPIFTIPYQGKRLPVYIDKSQWRSFRLVNDKEFRVTESVGRSKDRLMKEYNSFLIDKIKRIVDKYFDKLIQKTISFDIKYTDGSKKRHRISAKEYAKMMGIERVRYEIGSYEKEWGINQIDSKRKEFILHFNYNLLMYDKGDKIGYVVAHEVAHIFSRGHDKEFQETVEKLYSGARKYERFWDEDFSKI